MPMLPTLSLTSVQVKESIEVKEIVSSNGLNSQTLTQTSKPVYLNERMKLLHQKIQ